MWYFFFKTWQLLACHATPTTLTLGQKAIKKDSLVWYGGWLTTEYNYLVVGTNDTVQWRSLSIHDEHCDEVKTSRELTLSKHRGVIKKERSSISGRGEETKARESRGKAKRGRRNEWGVKRQILRFRQFKKHSKPRHGMQRRVSNDCTQYFILEFNITWPLAV